MFNITHIWFLILIGFLVDWIIGDPSNEFHPIYYLGKLIKLIEQPLYGLPLSKRVTGILLVFIVVTINVGIVLEVSRTILSTNIRLYYIWSILIFWICFALRSLIKSGEEIKYYLEQQNLKQARKALSSIVSRDTDNLSRKDVIRGTIESLSENLNDAVIAPLLYVFLFGLVGIVFYKTVNTLDSMVGYKNARYRLFGWFAARFDDVVNFIPARITFALIFIASFLLRYDYMSCWKSTMVYSQTGESPNGGIGICAFAGALEIQLGGTNYFNSKSVSTPKVGFGKTKLNVKHIEKSRQLIIVSTILGLIIFSLISLLR